MKRFLLPIVFLLLPCLAHAETLLWDAVTTYSDGVEIAPEDLPNITYRIYGKYATEPDSAYRMIASVQGVNTVKVSPMPFRKKSEITLYATADLDEMESGPSNLVNYLIPKGKPMNPFSLTVQEGL